MLVAKRESDYYYPEQIDIKEEKPRRAKKRKKKSNAGVKLLVIGFAIIGLILSLYILYGYADITKVRLNITELEKQKDELEREKEDLIAELEVIKSSSKIEEDAIMKLGMDYPTEEQIVYMEVNELAFTDEINTTDDFTLIKQLKNVVSLVLSFF